MWHFPIDSLAVLSHGGGHAGHPVVFAGPIAGWTHWQHHHRFPMLSHATIQISGTTMVRQFFILEPGDVFLFNGQMPHTAVCLPGELNVTSYVAELRAGSCHVVGTMALANMRDEIVAGNISRLMCLHLSLRYGQWMCRPHVLLVRSHFGRACLWNHWLETPVVKHHH